MQGMIPLLMPIILWYLVHLEGTCIYCLCTETCMYSIIFYIHVQHREGVGISTISITEHSVAQTRELACTKLVFPQVINQGT